MRYLFAFTVLASQAATQAFANYVAPSNTIVVNPTTAAPSSSPSPPTGWSIFTIGYVGSGCQKIGSVSWSKVDGDCSGYATSTCAGSYKTICVRGQSYKALPAELKAWEWAAVEKYATSQACEYKTGIQSAQLYPKSCAPVSDFAALKYSCESQKLSLMSYSDSKCTTQVSKFAFPIEGEIAPTCSSKQVNVECNVVAENAWPVTSPSPGAPTVAPTNVPLPTNLPAPTKDFFVGAFADASCSKFVVGSLIPNLYSQCPAGYNVCAISNSILAPASGSSKSLCAEYFTYREIADFTGSNKLVAIEVYTSSAQCSTEEGLLTATIFKAGICEKLGDYYQKFDCTATELITGTFTDSACRVPLVSGDLGVVKFSIPQGPFDCTNKLKLKCFDKDSVVSTTTSRTTTTTSTVPTVSSGPIKPTNAATSTQFSLFTVAAMIFAVFAL